eukprot:1221890-Amphidinium_carterae.1
MARIAARCHSRKSRSQTPTIGPDTRLSLHWIVSQQLCWFRLHLGLARNSNMWLTEFGHLAPVRSSNMSVASARPSMRFSVRAVRIALQVPDVGASNGCAFFKNWCLAFKRLFVL